MTTTFPPKPWEEGATFTNDTTGVGYTYSGGKWLASGGPKVEGEYLPLTGGQVNGQLKVAANGDAFSIVKKQGGTLLTSFTGSYSDDIQYWKQAKDYGNSKLEIVNGFKMEEYVAEEIAKLPEPAPTSSPLKKLRFARDKDWNNIRPGEFGLMNDSNGYVGKWSEVRQIYFLNVDSDGNRLMRNENAQDFSSYLGSAFTAVTSSGERPVLRVVPTGQAGGYVKLDYGKDLDLIYLGWTDKNCAALMTGTNDNLSNGQYFLFNIPDLFF